MTQETGAAVATAVAQEKEESAYAKRLREAGLAEIMVQVPIALHNAADVRAQRDGDIARTTAVRRALLAWVRDNSAEDNYGLAADFVLDESNRTRKTNGAPKSKQDLAFESRKERNVSQLAVQAYKARKAGNVAEAKAIEAKIEKFNMATNEEELVAAGAKPARERKNGEVTVTQAPANAVAE